MSVIGYNLIIDEEYLIELIETMKKNFKEGVKYYLSYIGGCDVLNEWLKIEISRDEIKCINPLGYKDNRDSENIREIILVSKTDKRKSKDNKKVDTWGNFSALIKLMKLEDVYFTVDKDKKWEMEYGEFEKKINEMLKELGKRVRIKNGKKVRKKLCWLVDIWELDKFDRVDISKSEMIVCEN